MKLLLGEIDHKEQLVKDAMQSVERERTEHLVTRRLHAEDMEKLRQDHAEAVAAEKVLRMRVEEQLKSSEGALREALVRNSDITLEAQRMAHEAEIRQKDLAETQRLLENSKSIVKSQVTQLSDLIERSDGIVLSMNEEISALKVEVATKSVEISKLREQASLRTDRLVSSLQQEVEDHKACIVVLEGRQAQELERLKVVAAAREKDNASIIETFKERLASVEKSLADKTEQCKALRQTADSFELELTQLVDQMEAAEAATAREREVCEALQIDIDRRTRHEDELRDRIDQKDRLLREAAAAHKVVEFNCLHLQEQLANQRQEHLVSVDAIQTRLDHVQSLFSSKLTTAVDSGSRRVGAAFELVGELVEEMEISTRRALEESRAGFDAAVNQALSVAHFFMTGVGRFRETESSMQQQVSELTKQKKNIRLVSSQIANSLLLQVEHAETRGELSFQLVAAQRQEVLLGYRTLTQRMAFIESELAGCKDRRATAELEVLKSQESLTLTQQQLLQSELSLASLKRDSSSLSSLAKNTAQRNSETEACLTRATTELVFFRQLVPALTEGAFESLLEHESRARLILTQLFYSFVSDVEAVLQRILAFASHETTLMKQTTDRLRSSAHQAIHEHASAVQFERERAAKDAYVARCVNQLQSVALVEGKERRELVQAEKDALCLHLLPAYFGELIHLLDFGHTKETQAVLHALHVSQKETVLLRSKTTFLAELEASAFAASLERLNRRREDERHFLCASSAQASSLQHSMCSVALVTVVDLEESARLTLSKTSLEALHSIYLLTLVAGPSSRRR
jgi:trans-aconitate methyltransferase